MSEAFAATLGQAEVGAFSACRRCRGARIWQGRRRKLSSKRRLALTAVVTTADIRPAVSVEVKCEAPDIELLFVEWLNAIIYEMAVRKMLFSRFAVMIDGTRLTGMLWGEPVDVARHAPACEPKGATYTALRVAMDESGVWSAACIVDV